MAIPEDQLEIWAKPGPTQQFVDTYGYIKEVLEDAKSPYYEKRNFNVHLQGSYGNDTNVRGDSDVDVVICTTNTFNYDLEHLTQPEKDQFDKVTTKYASPVNDFKQEVISWLSERYGAQNVVPGKKAILLKEAAHRRSADILVCTEHRQYFKFRTHGDDEHYKGVQFFASDGTSIVNFPKLHAKACTDKHQATDSRWFKPTIRVFKNMRNRMLEKGLIQEGRAPSYYIEGALWNVHDEKYGGSLQATADNCMNWLMAANRDDLLTANQRRWLLRDGKSDSWRPADFETWLAATIKFWNAGG